MKKSALVVTLALILSLFLPACTSAGPSNPPSSAPDSGEQGGASPAPTTAAYEAVFAFPVTFNQRDMAMIEEAMNKESLAKINVGTKLLPLSYSTYLQQYNLMIAGDEKVDLLVGWGQYLSSDVVQNKLMALNDYQAELQQAMDAIGADFMKSTKFNGKFYALPTIKDMFRRFGISMRKDIVEKHNIDLSAIDSFEKLPLLFEQIKTLEPNMVPTEPNNINETLLTLGLCTYDPLGDSMGVLLNYGADDLNVVNLYESEYYENTVKMIHDWYQKGYVLSDAATNPDVGVPLYKSGKVFSRFGVIKDKDATAADILGTSGQPTVCIILGKAFGNSTTVASQLMMMPVTCKNPTETAKLLNLFYTDATYINYIDYGIEGKHYVRTEGSDVLIKLPEGLTTDTSGYALNQPYMFGNQFISHAWEPQPEDIYKRFEEINKSAIQSKALGFTFNPTPVKSAAAAVSSVMQQYCKGLEDGSLDPETTLPTFRSALKSAGIDEVIAEKQRQLNAWAEGNQ